jgi:WD40 repeat protein
MAFDEAGTLLAIRDKVTGEIAVLETATGHILYRLSSRGLGFDTHDYTFLPDGKQLAAHRSFGHQVAVYDFLGEPRTTQATDAPDWISSIAVSADGRLLANGDSNNIQLRDTETLKPSGTLRGHQHEVIRLAFSPDGLRLASGDVSGAVKLWDIATGEELLDLVGLTDDVHLLQFAPDGLTLVGASTKDGGHFVVWNGHAHRSEPRTQGPGRPQSARGTQSD